MSDSDITQKFVLYRYTPSLVAAALFPGLFGVSAVIHAVQVRRNGAKYFTAFMEAKMNILSFSDEGERFYNHV
jgi:hypothetical protein